MHPLIIVHHVPKTSGSALRAALRDNLGSDRVYWHIADGHINDDIDTLKARGDRLAVIGGHVHYNVVERFGFDRPIIRVSMVREPMALIFSAINYVRKRPEHPNYTDVAPDTPEFLETSFFKRYSRTQCHTMTSFVVADRAIDRIHSTPYIVTTSENVDRLFLKIMEILREPITHPPRQVNVGSKDYSWFDQDKARELFRPGLSEDRRLYQYIVDDCSGWLDNTAQLAA